MEVNFAEDPVGIAQRKINEQSKFSQENQTHNNFSEALEALPCPCDIIYSLCPIS
jgi:hypothetical protein